jgi:hypothetical protein
MITIRLPDSGEATLHGGHWQATDSRLESLLNAMRAPWQCELADTDSYEAAVVSKVLGAVIIQQHED